MIKEVSSERIRTHQDRSAGRSRRGRRPGRSPALSPATSPARNRGAAGAQGCLPTDRASTGHQGDLCVPAECAPLSPLPLDARPEYPEINLQASEPGLTPPWSPPPGQTAPGRSSVHSSGAGSSGGARGETKQRMRCCKCLRLYHPERSSATLTDGQ